MICKHFSKGRIINKIFVTKELWLTRLIDCAGQEDFCLTEKMFFELISNLNFSKISYNEYFTIDKFKEMCKCRIINDKYKFYNQLLFGACLTKDGNNEMFQEKYGKCHISFNLDSIQKKNTDFLFICDVIYSLDDIEQFVYDLSTKLYIRGEYQTRIALDLSEEEMPDKYEDMLSRLFYYMKILYKLPKYEFEHETRIVVDANKIEKGVTEEFSGDGYHYTNNILEVIYGRHLKKDDDKFILLLDSFPMIDLKENK